MAEFPALPLWTDAYLGDTDHFDNLEHGIYLRTLILMWRSPRQRIPNDEEWIKRRLRLKDNELSVFRGIAATHLTTLRTCKCGALINNDNQLCHGNAGMQCQSDAEWLSQKRLMREWAFVKASSERQSHRAKKRWSLKDNDNPISPGNAAPHLSGNAPTPTPTPTPLRERAARATRLENDFEVPDDWLDAAAERRRSARLPEVNLKAEAIKFVAHARGIARESFNWPDAFTQWCMKSEPAKLNGVNGHGREPDKPKKPNMQGGSPEWKKAYE